MRQAFVVGILIIIAIAALTGSAALLPPVYLLISAYVIGRLWSGRSLKSITFVRRMQRRAFLNETVGVTLHVENRSALPAVWLKIRDQVPIDIRSDSFKQAITLKPYEKRRFDYTINAARRGLYQIGPIATHTSDPLGIVGDRAREEQAGLLTIYPRIVALPRLRLPSRSPFGHLRSAQPIYEDPSRLRGKRDYRTGDSLRSVDWKTTAVTGRLQVKQYEPSIALEAMLFVDLNTSKYGRNWIDGTELAIVTAASLANWVMEQHGEVGIATNGLDPIITAGADDAHLMSPTVAAPAASAGARRQAQPFRPIEPRKGRAHLMRVLDILARVKPLQPPGKHIQADEADDFPGLIRRERLNLSWGTTLIGITGETAEGLFDELFQARRAGLSVLLLMCGDVDAARSLRVAEHFGIPAYHIRRERDLETWTNEHR